MAAILTEAQREQRERQRLANFRREFVAKTPGWYRGEMHLGFTLLVTLGTAYYCWNHIHGASTAEWLIVVPIFLLGNWAEWAGHRYILHRPVPYLRMIYKRHCGTHHQFFTNHDLTYKGQKEWRALLFPPFAPILFILVSVPPALVLAAVWSANAGYIAVMTMALYFVMYEALHTLSHLSDERHPYLKYVPLVNTVRHMHVTHHNLGFMQTRNFNLTFPICDALFGTSDLDRGVLGTLFNGASNAHVRRDLQPEAPLAEFAHLGTGGGPTAPQGRAA